MIRALLVMSSVARRQCGGLATRMRPDYYTRQNRRLTAGLPTAATSGGSVRDKLSHPQPS